MKSESVHPKGRQLVRDTERETPSAGWSIIIQLGPLLPVSMWDKRPTLLHLAGIVTGVCSYSESIRVLNNNKLYLKMI